MRRGLLVLFLVGGIFLGGCRSAQPYEQTMVVMDTAVTLSASGEDAEAAVKESFQRLKVLERMASRDIPSSDAAKLNAAAGTAEYVKLHPEIYHLLEVSQIYSAKTAGAWDVTTGPLTDLWQIGSGRDQVPPPEKIQAAKRLVDYRKLQLRKSDQSARLMQAGMSVDFGGIAKGMALDEVRKIYAAHHIEQGMINLGSSTLYGVGKNFSGQAWMVGIRHPRKDESGTYLGILPLSDEVLSTSGDYERFFIKDGRRYHHIFDPRTGSPADTGAMSDTLLVPADWPDAGMVSDLLSTAAFVLGPEKGRQLLETLPGVKGEITGTNQALYGWGDFSSRLQSLSSDFHWAE